MFTETRPQPGSADAQSLDHLTTNGLSPQPGLAAPPSRLTPLAVSPVASMPATLDELARLRPGCSPAYVQRLLALCLEFSAVTGCRDFAKLDSRSVMVYVEAALARRLATSTVLFNVNALACMRRAAGRVGFGPEQEAPFRRARTLLEARSIHHGPHERQRRLDAVWQLLNAEEFISLKRSSLLSERATYWMVLLTLFTDMRVTELSLLSPADFAWTSYAGHLIRQRAQDPGRVQLHPVHRVLIECGFLDFIAERWACKAAYLFSDARSPVSLPRSVRRHLLESWGGRARGVPTPSWNEFRAARRAAAEFLLARRPDLRSRLADHSRSGTDGADGMDLVLDLEAALQFDDVNWTLHGGVKAAGV